MEIKQHAKVKNMGCILDESLSGESMALNIIDTPVNLYLVPPLSKLLFHALIQALFDYAYTALFPNLPKKLRLRLQAKQNA